MDDIDSIANSILILSKRNQNRGIYKVVTSCKNNERRKSRKKVGIFYVIFSL
jgi:hypothetical protein